MNKQAIKELEKLGFSNFEIEKQHKSYFLNQKFFNSMKLENEKVIVTIYTNGDKDKPMITEIRKVNKPIEKTIWYKDNK